MITIREMLLIGAGYLSGSVLYSYYLPKYLKKINVMEASSDGNPGAANVFKYAGAPMGILVLFLELLKGFVPVHLAIGMVQPSRVVFGLILAAPVLGHAFPFLHPSKGGKSIAVSFGVLLGLVPFWTPVLLLAAFYICFSVIVVIQPHFFRSVFTFLLFMGCVFFRVREDGIVLGCVLISVTVIYKHFVRYQGERLQVRFFRHKAREN